MSGGHARPEVVEKFTFRAGERSLTLDAVIDTGATQTVITEEVVSRLDLKALAQSSSQLADGSQVFATVYRCVVAWQIYESQGYYSEHDVLCLSDAQEILIGYDFLKRHDLKVDVYHNGLVGTAPDAAVPLTGGGYVINPPKGLVRIINYDRAGAAKSGDVLRPHPAWRFKVPVIVRRKEQA